MAKRDWKHLKRDRYHSWLYKYGRNPNVPEGRNEYKVMCPENCGHDVNCNACGGRGYNMVVFENGRRIA